MNHIFLFGHRQPDTDSIASVIAYAEFKNRSEPGRYIPARCGELNPESRYMLERFSIPEPVLIPSVKPRLSDITFKPVFSLPQDVPTVDVATLMAKEGIRNVVITDGTGKPVGMVGEHALAGSYIQKIHLAELAVTPLPVESLARILNATIIVSARQILKGRVYIAIDAVPVTLGKMTANDIAVVGDNEPAQLALVSAGIACLIIAQGALVGGTCCHSCCRTWGVCPRYCSRCLRGWQDDQPLPASPGSDGDKCSGSRVYRYDHSRPAGCLCFKIPGSMYCRS